MFLIINNMGYTDALKDRNFPTLLVLIASSLLMYAYSIIEYNLLVVIMFLFSLFMLIVVSIDTGLRKGRKEGRRKVSQLLNRIKQLERQLERLKQ